MSPSPFDGGGRALNHAMNHVRFMISPELYVVQDKVQDSHAPYVVHGVGVEKL